ncbi:PAS-domain containing protein [Pseudogemmobacter sp. W21_MBD1_M6]|uniref:PAS-domain containing protein n=1 Tax=Pseudogemmobacter sp. W21_MBD1_M6 TaxID=3240271 RepID=UPI003F96ED39
MQLPDYKIVLLVIVVSFAATTFALLLLSALTAPAKKTARALLSEAMNECVFIFDDETLIDATPRARRILATGPRGMSDWARFGVIFGPRFPDLSDKIGGLAEAGQLQWTSADSPVVKLYAEWWDGLARIVLDERISDGPLVDIDRQSLAAMEEELDTLRGTTDHAPFLVWKQAVNGQITWANQAYLTLAARFYPDEDVPTWPPRVIFPPAAVKGDPPAEGPRRIALDIPDKTVSWYEISARQIGNETLCFADLVNGTVRAEDALRSFVQTLTKTFAQLPIGLAIFDRKRQLVLFNPALTDLSSLPAEFLISKPTLYSFLDRLREKRMVPEPKDYKTWRDQMAELEVGATNGTFEENWALPTGQTYHVTGRPHPDGAVAFLFEDITAEISLTRRFRSDLELGQAIIDSLAEAIIVFSPNGVVATTNAAFVRLWGLDPDTTFGDMVISDVIAHWKNKSLPSAFWDLALRFVTGQDGRIDCSKDVMLSNGQNLQCRLRPLSGGFSMVSFATLSPEPVEKTAAWPDRVNIDA